MSFDLPQEWIILDKMLREGSPTDGWPGDPNMELRIGQVVAGRSGHDPNLKRWVRKGTVVAQRLEVWRHTENHGDQRIGTWHPDEAPFIIQHLVQMDPSRPRHVNVLDRIDAHNAVVEEAAAQAYRELSYEMHEHFAKLQHDLTQPRNVFRGMPGTRDDESLKREPADASE